MRFLPRLVILTGLVYLCVVLYQEGRRLEAVETADQSQVFLIFAGTLLSALAGGIILAVTILPLLGEKLGDLIYGTGDDSPQDPFLMAQDSIDEGKYLEAISYYRQALAGDPNATSALAGIADVQTNYLGDSEAAVELLQKALEKPWPRDEQSFLRYKLAEIYGRDQGDMEKARVLLVETIEAYPGTAQARHAEHLLHKLEAG